VAFVQVLGGHKGFLFLTNRLMAPGRTGSAMKTKEHPPAAAENIKVHMLKFFLDKKQLQEFYDEQIASLPPAPAGVEEPPALAI